MSNHEKLIISKEVQQVTADSFKSRPADGRVPGNFPEALFIHGMPFLARELEEPGRRSELGFIVFPGFAVPGAHVLADVAAKNAVFHFPPEFRVDIPFVLDGKVGDTAPGIHHPRGHDCLGGAGVDAACAGAAPVGKFPYRHSRNLLVDQQDSDKETASVHRGNKHAVLPGPSKSGPSGPGPLQQGCGIHKSPAAAGCDLLTDPAEEFVHLLLHDRVIVASECVFRNDGGGGISGGVAGEIILQDDNHTPGAFMEEPGVESLLPVPLHVRHGAVHALLQPQGKPRSFLRQLFCHCNAALQKSQLCGNLLDLLLISGFLHRAHLFLATIKNREIQEKNNLKPIPGEAGNNENPAIFA